MSTCGVPSLVEPQQLQLRVHKLHLALGHRRRPPGAFTEPSPNLCRALDGSDTRSASVANSHSKFQVYAMPPHAYGTRLSGQTSKEEVDS